MSAVHTTRRPYMGSYTDLKGVYHNVRRVPPPKLHTVLPQDVVELTQKKNDDWVDGEEYTVKAISPRQPNIVQITNEDSGEATFVPYFDLDLDELEVAHGTYLPKQRRRSRDKIAGGYLLWP